MPNKYKGVYAFRGRWMAQIRIHYQSVFLGMFDNEEAAARAYDDAKKKFIENGEWVSTSMRVNFGPPVEMPNKTAETKTYVPPMDYSKVFEDNTPYDDDIECAILEEIGLPTLKKTRLVP